MEKLMMKIFQIDYERFNSDSVQLNVGPYNTPDTVTSMPGEGENFNTLKNEKGIIYLQILETNLKSQEHKKREMKVIKRRKLLNQKNLSF